MSDNSSNDGIIVPPARLQRQEKFAVNLTLQLRVKAIRQLREATAWQILKYIYSATRAGHKA
jgi:hypothetical protein